MADVGSCFQAVHLVYLSVFAQNAIFDRYTLEEDQLFSSKPPFFGFSTTKVHLLWIYNLNLGPERLYALAPCFNCIIGLHHKGKEHVFLCQDNGKNIATLPWHLEERKEEYTAMDLHAYVTALPPSRQNQQYCPLIQLSHTAGLAFHVQRVQSLRIVLANQFDWNILTWL